MPIRCRALIDNRGLKMAERIVIHYQLTILHIFPLGMQMPPLWLGDLFLRYSGHCVQARCEAIDQIVLDVRSENSCHLRLLDDETEHLLTKFSGDGWALKLRRRFQSIPDQSQPECRIGLQVRNPLR
jgi:hypothetical protein